MIRVMPLWLLNAIYMWIAEELVRRAKSDNTWMN
jgi:hypothetical protein